MLTVLMASKEHPWVTKQGTDPLLSAEENTAHLVEPPSEEEMNRAITGNLSNLILVVRVSILITYISYSCTKPSSDESSQ